jgi:hypothetical protein
MATQNQTKMFLMIIFSLFLLVGGYYVLSTPDTRSTGTKISDAIDELPEGLDKAARQLEDRTPAEKLDDAAHDATKDLKKSINQQ